MVRATTAQSPWNGSLLDLSSIVTSIRRSRAFGRLTLRNVARLGVAHLYFQHGDLVHVVGTRGDARATLDDVRGWSRAMVRFERGIAVGDAAMRGRDEYEQLLDEVIAQLQMRGVVGREPEPPPPPMPRVVEGHLVATTTVEADLSRPGVEGISRPRPMQSRPDYPPTPGRDKSASTLISPSEWNLLVEGTRRVSLAVAHLVGPREAMDVLGDILDDCIAAFPSLAGLQIAPGGYVQATSSAQLDRVPRAELLEGFAALFATCQHFCAPIIGDEDAHRLMVQAVGDLAPTLVSLGVFQLADHTLPKARPWYER